MQIIGTVVILAAYVAALLWVGLRARMSRGFADFSVARRRLALAFVFASLSAAYVGPGFSVGFVGEGFTGGLLFLGIGLAYAVQNVVVGLWIAPRLRAFGDCHTLGDVVGRIYGPTCQVWAGLVSVGLCTGLAAVMAKAGGTIVADVVGTPFWVGVVVVVGLTCAYTTFGGLWASVMTDAFHFAAFALFVPILFFWIVTFHVQGGPAAFAHEAVVATRAGWQASSTAQVVGLVVAFLLGETLIPPYAHRALASKTTRVSRNSFLLAGGFSVVWFTLMVALGVAARGIVLAGTHKDSVLTALVKTAFPLPCHALLLVVLMAIVMSSLDSLLNAGAVSFAQDLVHLLFKTSDRQSLIVGRVATVAIAVTAGLAATAVPGIIQGLLFCYNVWAPAILPALILGLCGTRPRAGAGILSMVAGGGAAILLQVDPAKAWIDAAGIPAIVLSLVVSVAAYAGGHWLAPRRGVSP